MYKRLLILTEPIHQIFWQVPNLLELFHNYCTLSNSTFPFLASENLNPRRITAYKMEDYLTNSVTCNVIVNLIV